MKIKLQTISILLFNHFILINYGSEHNKWLSSANKIIISNNFRALGEEIYLTFALFPLPSLCPLPSAFPFLLIKHNNDFVRFKNNFTVRADNLDIAFAQVEIIRVFDP